MHGVTLWGWHTTSFIVLRCLVPSMMPLMMHQPHLHQPWGLDRHSPFTGSFSMSKQSMSNTSDVHLAHELLHCASTFQQTVHHKCSAHKLAEQGTQESCGIRPLRRAGHIAHTTAGHGGCRCGGPCMGRTTGRLWAPILDRSRMAHATNTERLHQQGPGRRKACGPSKAPGSMYTNWHRPSTRCLSEEVGSACARCGLARSWAASACVVTFCRLLKQFV